ncbi:hypothetical protein ABH313_19935 [Chromobacterium vaccinii]
MAARPRESEWSGSGAPGGASNSSASAFSFLRNSSRWLNRLARCANASLSAWVASCSASAPAFHLERASACMRTASASAASVRSSLAFCAAMSQYKPAAALSDSKPALIWS